MGGELRFGCPLVTEEEITVAVEAMARESKHIIGGQGARNLAYHVLVDLRAAYFKEKEAMDKRVETAKKRIAEIDAMFEKATGWGSWMTTASHERRDLVRELSGLGVDVEHKWQVRYG